MAGGAHEMRTAYAYICAAATASAGTDFIIIAVVDTVCHTACECVCVYLCEIHAARAAIAIIVHAYRTRRTCRR